MRCKGEVPKGWHQGLALSSRDQHQLCCSHRLAHQPSRADPCERGGQICTGAQDTLSEGNMCFWSQPAKVQPAEVLPCRHPCLSVAWHQDTAAAAASRGHWTASQHRKTAQEDLKPPTAGARGGHCAAKPCSCLLYVLQASVQSRLHVLMPFWRKEQSCCAAQTACAGLACDDHAVHAHLKWSCTYIRQRALMQPPKCHTLPA